MGADQAGGVDGNETRPHGNHQLLIGENVALRPIRPQDYDALFEFETVHLGPTWRLKGETPSFERYVQSLWQGVLAQFIVVNRMTHSPAGFVTAYSPNFRDAWCYFATAKFDRSDRSTTQIEGTVLFLEYLFTTWDFNKLYAEVLDDNIHQFDSAIGRFCVEEARLREHEQIGGRMHDQIILAVYRRDWEVWRRFVLPRVRDGQRIRQNGTRPTREWPSADITTQPREASR